MDIRASTYWTVFDLVDNDTVEKVEEQSGVFTALSQGEDRWP